MATRNVSLTKHFDDLIEKRVRSGRYDNASEVVREGLRLLEQRDRNDAAKLKRLRAAVQVGIDQIERGEYVDVPGDKVGEFLAGIGRRARQSLGKRRGRR